MSGYGADLGVPNLDQAAAGFIEQGAHGGAFIIAARRRRKDTGRIKQVDFGIEAGAGTSYLNRGAGGSSIH